MEKLTYTHNEAAAKVLASFYDTPPLAYVRSEKDILKLVNVIIANTNGARPDRA